ncbi:MAG: hypothetical protein RLZZ215_1341 [Pseudomonadota bacterium]
MINLQDFKIGAGTRNRTEDLLITSQLLYQLSYTGVEVAYTIRSFFRVQVFNS